MSKREFETAQNSQTEAQNIGYLGRCGVRRKTYDCQHFLLSFATQRMQLYVIMIYRCLLLLTKKIQILF